MVRELEGILKGKRVSEYEASSSWREKVDHADLVCKNLSDFVNFILNTINPPLKSQKPYKVLVRNINGKYWFHTNCTLLNAHNVVAYQSDDIETDIARIKAECKGIIDFVFC